LSITFQKGTKQTGTNGTDLEQSKQRETNNLKARVEKLRADGKTYRDIAKQERISIAQISRILNQPEKGEADLKPQTSETDFGEQASRVFELLEKGNPLPKIVIRLKMSPNKVEELNEMWMRLKETDVNQPIVMEKIRELDEVLVSHVDNDKLRHQELEALKNQAKESGEYKMKHCGYVNGYGFCTCWSWKKTDGESYYKKPDSLRCAFCHRFSFFRP